MCCLMCLSVQTVGVAGATPLRAQCSRVLAGMTPQWLLHKAVRVDVKQVYTHEW